jgi:hypothetical protein
MWEPVGPLPATIYWKRRLTAASTAIAVLGLLVWTIVSITTSTQDTSSRAASRAAVTAPQPTNPPPASSATPTQPTPGTGDQPVGSPRQAGGSATAERLSPDESPRSALPAPPPIQVPSTGPVPCTDSMIGVTAEIDPAQHRVGQRPTLRLVVTNISDQPCVRDLDSARQEIVVWSLDGERLWSSNDCVNGSTVDLRTLVPGQPVAFAVSWAGRTSAPGCVRQRTVVPAGRYHILSRVDNVVSASTHFERLP